MANDVHELWEQNVEFPSSLDYLTSGPLGANVPITVFNLFSHVPSSTQLASNPGLTTRPGLGIPNSDTIFPQPRLAE